ncbi:MAG: bifunctional chorismate mutase/prephenate dehydratase [Ruminococcaceae bacterium]|nr:bifunctional chorismate mutase/prephenate dehydratase [Oscillospiraceae bacterium]
MDIKDLREKIDVIDEQLVKLFGERMAVAKDIAEYKKEKDVPVLDVMREREKLASVSDMSADEFKEYTRVLYSLIFELSRSYQGSILNRTSALYNEIVSAIDNTDKMFPKSVTVACQGTEGAYSQIACDKLVRDAKIMYCAAFENVFAAIESGMCRYGILPIENSSAGSVNKIYDLMIKHNFHIVRSTRIKIDHSLLARPGVKLADVKEIFSHEQAIAQCSGFLKKLGVKVTCCENTAVAAEMIAKSDRTDIAALCSRHCADLYGLTSLEESVQDAGNNHTRFICISKNLEIYPGADKTSVMMILPHKPGSLYRVLARFYSLGINLIKLESRPIPERDFEFMFYFDLETSVYSSEFAQLMSEFDSMCEDFKYLGSYTEVI